MSWGFVSEEAFRERVDKTLGQHALDDVGCVTGPGRSGAVDAVYVSHKLRVPFIPYGAKAPTHLGALLIADTAQQSGATIRKAVRRYQKTARVKSLVFFDEPPRVRFWYEAEKPQQYRHECPTPQPEGKE